MSKKLLFHLDVPGPLPARGHARQFKRILGISDESATILGLKWSGLNDMGFAIFGNLRNLLRQQSIRLFHHFVFLCALLIPALLGSLGPVFSSKICGLPRIRRSVLWHMETLTGGQRPPVVTSLGLCPWFHRDLYQQVQYHLSCQFLTWYRNNKLSVQ